MDPLQLVPDNKTHDELLDEWNLILRKHLIVNDIVVLLYLTLGVTGNLVVILMYLLKMKIKRDDRFFIPVLACIDLTACVFGASFAFAWNIIPVKFNSGIVCEILWFMSQASTIISGLTLIIIAIHRYVKVCKPTTQFSRKLKKTLIALSIVFACAFSAPIFVFYGAIEIKHPTLNVTGQWCGQKRHDIGTVIYYDISVVTVALIAAIVLATLYILIGRKIYRKFLVFKTSIREGKYTRTRGSTAELDSVTVPSVETEKCSKDHNSRNDSTDNLAEGEPLRKTLRHASSEDILDNKKFSTIGQHFKTHRYSYMFMTITILFILAYAPRVTIQLLETLYPDFWNRSNGEISGFLFLYRLYILNHVLNPIIYAFFDTRFRKELKEFFCCK